MFELRELHNHLQTLSSSRDKDRLLKKVAGGGFSKIDRCKLVLIDKNTASLMRDTTEAAFISANTLRTPAARQSVKLVLLSPVDTGNQRFSVTRLEALVRSPFSSSATKIVKSDQAAKSNRVSNAASKSPVSAKPGAIKLSFRDKMALQHALESFITSKLNSLARPKIEASPRVPRAIAVLPTIFEQPMNVSADDGKVHLNRRQQNEFVELAKWCFQNRGARLEIAYENEAGQDANGPVRDALTAALSQLERYDVIRFDRTTQLFELNQIELTQGNVREQFQRFEALGHILGRIAILNSHSLNFTTDMSLGKTIFDVIVNLRGVSEQFENSVMARYLFGRLSNEGKPITAQQALSSIVKTRDAVEKLRQLLLSAGMPALTSQDEFTRSTEERWIHQLGLTSTSAKQMVKTLSNSFSAGSAKSLVQSLGGWLIPRMALSKGYQSATLSVRALANDHSADAVMLRLGIISGKSLKLELQDVLTDGKSDMDFFNQRFEFDMQSPAILRLSQEKQESCEANIREYMVRYIKESTEEQAKNFVKCVWGTPVLPKNKKILLSFSDVNNPNVTISSCAAAINFDVAHGAGEYAHFKEKVDVAVLNGLYGNFLE